MSGRKGARHLRRDDESGPVIWGEIGSRDPELPKPQAGVAGVHFEQSRRPMGPSTPPRVFLGIAMM